MIYSPEALSFKENNFTNLNARDVDAKLRAVSFSFTVTADMIEDNETGFAVVGIMPAGRTKILPHLSQIHVSGSGNYSVGLGAYLDLSSRTNTVVENKTSVSTAVAAGAVKTLVGPVEGLTYESLTAVELKIFGTFAVNQTVKGTIIFAQN